MGAGKEEGEEEEEDFVMYLCEEKTFPTASEGCTREEVVLVVDGRSAAIGVATSAGIAAIIATVVDQC